MLKRQETQQSMSSRHVVSAALLVSTVNWRGVGWFLVIAFAVAWLLELPIVLDPRGVLSPWVLLILLVNYAPALATLLVVRRISPEPRGRVREVTGLRLGVPWRTWLLYCALGLFGITIINVASPFVGALFGQFPLDLKNFSELRVIILHNPGGARLLRQVPIQTLAWLTIVTLPLQSLFLIPFTFGEEYGWRGYLLPKLLPLGQWPALLLTGAIWGVWHAPLLLIGWNYPKHHLLGVLLFTIALTIMGTLIGWTRLATGSVWPAVIAHAALDQNEVLRGVLVLLKAGAPFDTATATVDGWTGWIVPLLLIAVLVLTKRLPVRNPPDLEGVTSRPGVPTSHVSPAAL
jgi:membrane protease YdiL (CAAX protease family)